jgi:tetratricopeptide (TPR) repeat protein
MRTLSKIILAIALIGFAPAMRAGDDFTKDFERANQQYDQGKFNEAKKLYDSIVANGHYSAVLFYNLGNAEFRLDHKGESILNYERALALEPAHPEARANLAFARDQTGAKIAARDWRDLILADLNPNTYSWAAALAGWIGLFAFVSILLKLRTDNQALWLALVCCAAVFGYTIFAIRHLDKERTVAIVTAKVAEARFAPADNSTLAATLPTGSRVWILEQRGAWSYCELPDNNRAWISASTIERVRLKNS